MVTQEVREIVLYMIQEETKRYRPTKNYLEHLGEENVHMFETELLKNEMERLEGQDLTEVFKELDMKRYELPQPSISKQNDVSEWLKCLENSQAQLEHQYNRILNLKLLNIYGTETWKKFNEHLSNVIEELKKYHLEIRKQINIINYERKNNYHEAEEKLKHLEANWVSLVSKNFEIEQECVKLEKEIDMLKKYKNFSKTTEIEIKNE